VLNTFLQIQITQSYRKLNYHRLAGDWTAHYSLPPIFVVYLWNTKITKICSL